MTGSSIAINRELYHTIPVHEFLDLYLAQGSGVL